MQKLIYGIGGFVVLLIAIGFLLPSSHRVEVQREIDAHAATLFALVNDFERFAEWSPWLETDPDAVVSYSGPQRGVGATMHWNGSIVGSGTQQIVESRPYEYVGILLSPGEAAESSAWFRLSPGVGTTIVTWGFERDHGYNVLARYFATLMGGVVARDYAAGLERLETLAEGLPGSDFSGLDVEHLTVAAYDIAMISTTSAPAPDAVADALGKAYFAILSAIDANGLVSTGPPLSILKNPTGTTMNIVAGIPIGHTASKSAQDLATTTFDDQRIKLSQTYGGPALRVRHRGSYGGLPETHRKISAYIAALGLTINGAPWESYITDPADTPEAEWVTLVYYPLLDAD